MISKILKPKERSWYFLNPIYPIIKIPILYTIESENRLAEKGLDLSGLDDLLAEVNKKGNDYQEVVMKKQVLIA